MQGTSENLTEVHISLSKVTMPLKGGEVERTDTDAVGGWIWDGLMRCFSSVAPTFLVKQKFSVRVRNEEEVLDIRGKKRGMKFS